MRIPLIMRNSSTFRKEKNDKQKIKSNQPKASFKKMLLYKKSNHRLQSIILNDSLQKRSVLIQQNKVFFENTKILTMTHYAYNPKKKN